MDRAVDRLVHANMQHPCVMRERHWVAPRASISVCQAKRGQQPPSPSDPPEPKLEVSVEEVEAHLGLQQQAPNASDNKGKVTQTRRSGCAPVSRAEARVREKRPPVAARARELGLSPKQLRTKLKELLQLLPVETESKLLSLDTEDLQDLICDTRSVACRLVEARSRLPMGLPTEIRWLPRQKGEDVTNMLWEHPELLSSRHWDGFSSSIPVASLLGHTGGVTVVGITPDGRHAVSGSRDSTLRVWDLQAHTCVATLQGHTSTVWYLAISPDGRHAVSGSSDNTLRVWDLQAYSCVATLCDVGFVSSLAITADGSCAVAGATDCTLRLWDLHRHSCVATFEGHLGTVRSVAVSPDGRHAVSGSDDRTLRVWDLQQRSCTATLQGHRGGVWAVAITPDGRHAVSGSTDDSLRVWDLQSQTCVGTLQGSTHTVWSVAITPDGRHAATAGYSNVLQVWDLQAYTSTATLRGHTNHVASVAITPDGRHAVSGGLDSTLRVWDLQPHTGRAVAPVPEGDQQTAL